MVLAQLAMGGRRMTCITTHEKVYAISVPVARCSQLVGDVPACSVADDARMFGAPCARRGSSLSYAYEQVGGNPSRHLKRACRRQPCCLSLTSWSGCSRPLVREVPLGTHGPSSVSLVQDRCRAAPHPTRRSLPHRPRSSGTRPLVSPSLGLQADECDRRSWYWRGVAPHRRNASAYLAGFQSLRMVSRMLS